MIKKFTLKADSGKNVSGGVRKECSAGRTFGSEAAYKADENWKELFKETTGISSIEAAKGNAKVKKLFRNGKTCIGDYTIAGLRVL